ncbi:zinc metalloprotease [Alphaproteobacteria bacterium]|nr:zinc metalloprotease [Alphaproteobacteria bacterium]
MQLIQIISHNIFSFILVISGIVFIHEFGHFIVARLCGVKVEQFSIGFGKKLFSFKDKKNTEWKFCLLPFGGYVKMYGDANGASIPNFELVKTMSENDKKISFIAKNVYQRMAIVFAGPLANIILAIVIFTILFKINGIATISNVIDDVVDKSPAMKAGLKPKDEIIEVNGKQVNDFNEIKSIILFSVDEKVQLVVKRKNKIIDMTIAPEYLETKDMIGDKTRIKVIGIIAAEAVYENANLWRSFVEANKESYQISVNILRTIGHLITGYIPVKELGGPVKIARYSSKTIEMGWNVVLWFCALISLNLAIMNLLPIPVLDGGHLFFYIIEAIIRKPVSPKIQMIGFKIGFALVLALMIFTTLNDIRNLFVK